MKANINNTTLQVTTIPRRYTRPNGQTVERYDLRDDLWHDDGWRDVVVPTFNQETQELGQLIYNQQNDVVTYEVVDLPPLTPEEIQQKAIDTRNELLSQGVDVVNNGITFHFVESTLNNFITATQLTEKVGGTIVKWKDKSGNWVDVGVNDAYQISAIGMQMIQQIYIDN